MLVFGHTFLHTRQPLFPPPDLCVHNPLFPQPSVATPQPLQDALACLVRPWRTSAAERQQNRTGVGGHSADRVVELHHGKERHCHLFNVVPCEFSNCSAATYSGRLALIRQCTETLRANGGFKSNPLDIHKAVDSLRCATKRELGD